MARRGRSLVMSLCLAAAWLSFGGFWGLALLLVFAGFFFKEGGGSRITSRMAKLSELSPTSADSALSSGWALELYSGVFV